MIQIAGSHYYKIPGFMYGCAVDERLKDQLTAITDEYRERVLRLFKENAEHVHSVYTDFCFPHGVHADFHKKVPHSESWFDALITEAEKELTVTDCGLVIETNESYGYDDKIRGMAQKILEEKSSGE